MKKIHQYIFVELIKFFFLSLAGLVMVLFLIKSLVLVKVISARGLTFSEVAQMTIFISPIFLAVTIPPSLFIGSLLVFTRFSSENEYIAMKMSGWEFLYLIRPLIIFSLLAFLITSFLMFVALPWGTHSLKRFLSDILTQRTHFQMKPRVFNHDFEDLVLYFQGVEEKVKMKKLFVAHNSSKDKTTIIQSEEGTLIPEPNLFKLHLQMQNGVSHETDKFGRKYNIIQFKEYDILIPLPDIETLLKETLYGGVNLTETSVKEYQELIKRKTANGETVFWEQVVLSRKFAIPFSCLMFALAGAPLGIALMRSGKSGPFVLGGMVALVYYFLWMVVQKLGSAGVINPYVSVWIPNALLTGFTFYAVRQAQRDCPIIGIDHVNSILEIFDNLMKTMKLKKYPIESKSGLGKPADQTLFQGKLDFFKKGT